MAKDEGLLRRAAEFRAVDKALKGDTSELEELWGYRRFRDARTTPWLTHWHATLDRAAGDYWDHLHNLRAGDAGALEPSLVFLETHPRFFRSGYLAQALIAAVLRRPELRFDTIRLQDIALGILDDGSSRELRSAANLASEVWNARMEAALDYRLQIARDDNDHPQRRAIEFFREQALRRRASRLPPKPLRQSAPGSVKRREMRRSRRIRQVTRALAWALTEYGHNHDKVEFHDLRSIAQKYVDLVASGAADDELADYLFGEAVRLGTPGSHDLKDNVNHLVMDSAPRIRTDIES